MKQAKQITYELFSIMKKRRKNKINKTQYKNKLKNIQEKVIRIERSRELLPNAWLQFLQVKYIVKNQLKEMDGVKRTPPIIDIE